MLVVLVSACEPPPRENIKIIDGHIYIWSYSTIRSQYQHDPKCPQCQHDQRCQHDQHDQRCQQWQPE